MKKLSRNSLIILILISLFFLISCSFDESDFSDLSMKNLPDEISDSVRIVATNFNKTDYILDAVHIERFYDSKITKADTIFVQTFDINGQLKSTLYSDKADMDEISNILVAESNVKIESDNGTLLTQYLTWDRSTDKIYAKGKVTIIRNENVLKGYELYTDINLDKLDLINVTAEGKLDNESLNW